LRQLDGRWRAETKVALGDGAKLRTPAADAGSFGFELVTAAATHAFRAPDRASYFLWVDTLQQQLATLATRQATPQAAREPPARAPHGEQRKAELAARPSSPPPAVAPSSRRVFGVSI